MAQCSKLLLLTFLVSLSILHCNTKPLMVKNANAFQTDFYRPRHKDGFIVRMEKKIVGGMESSLAGVFESCSSCKLAADLLQELHNKHGDVMSAMDWICTHFHIETAEVCEGMKKLFKDEMDAILELSLSSSQICGIIVGPQCSSDADPFQSWSIDLPHTKKPPVEPIPTPKPDAPKLRVLHLTDIHFDPFYLPGSNAECNHPLCCREGSPKAGSEGAGKWGDYRNCDMPMWTLQKALEHISKHEKFDYIMWTGDLPPHDVWMQTRESQLAIIRNVTELMLQYFPGKPIFPALGNHEGNPVNSFPPDYVTGNDSMAWLYDVLAETWTASWLPSSVKTSVKHGAYYSIQLGKKLRLLSLNMNYCNDMNWWLMINMTDPNGELAWLINQLQDAENVGDKVHIIGHIPPGTNDCLKAWSNNYYKIINRYESTVRAQFFGHTHRDHFQLFYDDAAGDLPRRATSVAYIAPSLTPYTQMNIGYRVYTLDGAHAASSHIVLDHETRVANLSELNRSDGGDVEWQLEYTARDAYKMASLRPSDWDDLVDRMEKDDDLFMQYFRYSYKLHRDVCDSDCKKAEICLLRSGKSWSAKELCSKG
ncbi:PREDICTED: sphingomyelin phosphodiesterase-like [Priapulus caudatus]|uniref:Sphingomyelin phosphodiesterase n=1 Tax=Priapulus caudatus TaxID=37621 RepID=A0ABM1EZU6_PRICU|nr:PREDICTED: sphingomyelin phosphodiesterase-like [Priapulus caudatus]